MMVSHNEKKCQFVNKSSNIVLFHLGLEKKGNQDLAFDTFKFISYDLSALDFLCDFLKSNNPTTVQKLRNNINVLSIIAYSEIT